jgi:hypothetical protein
MSFRYARVVCAEAAYEGARLPASPVDSCPPGEPTGVEAHALGRVARPYLTVQASEGMVRG